VCALTREHVGELVRKHQAESNEGLSERWCAASLFGYHPVALRRREFSQAYRGIAEPFPTQSSELQLLGIDFA